MPTKTNKPVTFLNYTVHAPSGDRDTNTPDSMLLTSVGNWFRDAPYPVSNLVTVVKSSSFALHTLPFTVDANGDIW